MHSFRWLHSIAVGSFLTDLKSSQLITGPPKSLGPLVTAYDTTLSSLLDKTRSHHHQNSPSVSLHQVCGFLPSSMHFGPPSAMPKTSGNVLTLLLTGPPSSSPKPTPQAHPVFQKEYYSSFVSSASDSLKRLWQTVSKLIHCKSSSLLPTTSCLSGL